MLPSAFKSIILPLVIVPFPESKEQTLPIIFVVFFHFLKIFSNSDVNNYLKFSEKLSIKFKSKLLISTCLPVILNIEVACIPDEKTF